MAPERKSLSLILADLAEYLAISFTGLIFLPVLVFCAELFVRNDIFKWQLPAVAAFWVPFFSLYLLKDYSAKVKALALLLFACGLAKALFIANLFYDTSWDGRAYHADAILLLLHGTNPVYEMMHGFDDLWTNNYPKMTWYFAAIVTHLTGNYNLGKCYNLLLIHAVFTYVFSFLKRRETSTGASLLAATAAAVNPVAIDQLHCFYVDGALASLVTLALFSALALLKESKPIDRLVFFMASCLLITIKFTGAAFAGLLYILCATVMLVRWRKSRSAEDFAQGKNLACLMILAGLIGTIVMGFNPYVTNILVHRNLFYPLMGKGSIDIIAAQNPKSFNEENHGVLVETIQSIFSESENIADKGGTAEPEWKVPFSVDEKETSLFFASDIRIGGWGVLFSGALVSGVLLYLLSGSWRNREITLVLVFIFLSIVVNPGSWWARYAPQIALLPLFMALPSLVSQQRWQRISAKFVLVVLLLNSVLILPPNTRFYAQTSHALQKQIDAIIKTCGRGRYELSDTNGYHLDQFLLTNGITITYPAEDIRKTKPAGALLPLQDAFLYKEGCVRH